MRSVLRTDVGRIRKHNEDAAYIGDGLCLVCDGMGGHKAGDVASNLAVDTVVARLVNEKPSVQRLMQAIAEANDRVYQHAASDEDCRGMGSTLTALWAAEEFVFLAQVGDSRAYLLRGGVLRRCTHDHSLVAELVRAGAITEAEAREHPQRNLITRAIGTEPRVDVDIFEVSRHPGDRWLLCSDGLTNYVTDEELLRMLSMDSLYDAADALLALALARGGADNITLLLLEEEGVARHD